MSDAPSSIQDAYDKYEASETARNDDELAAAMASRAHWRDWSTKPTPFPSQTRWILPKFEHSNDVVVPDCTIPFEEIDSGRPSLFTTSFSNHDEKARGLITRDMSYRNQNDSMGNTIQAFVDINTLQMIPYDLASDVLAYVPAVQSLLDTLGV